MKTQTEKKEKKEKQEKQQNYGSGSGSGSGNASVSCPPKNSVVPQGPRPEALSAMQILILIQIEIPVVLGARCSLPAAVD
ncbi:GL19608 [Drosophila persimilis]|uniref:GL19608 n=1 Tax=Drosophila persimilis TaxID=7234 RepID=B4G7C7_DROPE|nr:GL19608 [Drosophila persimilis]